MAVRIKLEDLTEDQKKKIRKYLYMQPKTTGFFKKKRFVQAKDPILMYYVDKPKGEIVLPYTFANTLLGRHINSERSYPSGHFDFVVPLLERQVPVVKEAMDHLKTTGTTTLGCYPGFGKTAVAAYLASQVGGLVLVVHPLTMVIDSWVNTFKTFTNAQVWNNDGKTPMPSSCNVIITMDTQYHKISNKVLSMIKVLIIDEAHKFCVPSRVHCLLGVTPQYVIACTATLKRTDGMETIIHSVCGTHGIFLKSSKRYTVYRLSTNIKVVIEKNKRGDPDWSKLVRKLCEHPLRNDYIVDLVRRNNNHKIIILTWNKKHAFYLRNRLVQEGFKADVLAGNKSTYKDSQILVGTIAKISEGFDEKMVCPDWGGKRSNMLILTGSTKNISGLDQMTGRVFRSEYPTIIDLVDNNRICKRHWSERRKFYEDPERNGVIHYIEMKKDENYQEPRDTEMTNKRISSAHKNMIDRVKSKIQ